MSPSATSTTRTGELSAAVAIYAAAKTFRPRVTSTRPPCLDCQTRITADSRVAF